MSAPPVSLWVKWMDPRNTDLTPAELDDLSSPTSRGPTQYTSNISASYYPNGSPYTPFGKSIRRCLQPPFQRTHFQGHLAQPQPVPIHGFSPLNGATPSDGTYPRPLYCKSDTPCPTTAPLDFKHRHK